MCTFIIVDEHNVAVLEPVALQAALEGARRFDRRGTHTIVVVPRSATGFLSWAVTLCCDKEGVGIPGVSRPAWLTQQFNEIPGFLFSPVIDHG